MRSIFCVQIPRSILTLTFLYSCILLVIVFVLQQHNYLPPFITSAKHQVPGDSVFRYHLPAVHTLCVGYMAGGVLDTTNVRA